MQGSYHGVNTSVSARVWYNTPMQILIKNGRVLDAGCVGEQYAKRTTSPASGLDAVCDVAVAEGRVCGLGESAAASLAPDKPCRVIEAAGLWVTPGFVDLHVHLREPGQTHKETLESGARAAAAGGFTTVCCMPNTEPVADSVETIRYIAERAREKGGGVNILPVASITVGQRGEELVPMEALVRAGACAFSEDGKSVANENLMREAFRRAAALNVPIFSHCEDKNIAKDGVVSPGAARRFGLSPIPPEAESAIVERDILLARGIENARLHICHVSAARSVELIKKYQNELLTAEVCPHHFSLCDGDIKSDDGNYKMNPPLQSAADRAVLLEGLRDGVLPIIATDHAPHALNEKTRVWRIPLLV
uniref:Dihydroorotase n=1 Tax=uncultured bacterium contig00034 TaxID=1181523 RepID=A0A806JYS7_9BACT|nr:dihydroorotase [uncultured bacterium contig00034]